MMKFIGLSAKDFEDFHEGKPAWIVSSGPSIISIDLSQIEGGVSFFINGAVRLIDQVSSEAKYFVTSDERFLSEEDNRALVSTNLPSDVLRLVRDKCRPVDVYSAVSRTLYVRSLGRNGFSRNLMNGYYFGCTSTMLAVQFAYWSGCNPVILLGTDLTYPFSNKRFYDEAKPQPADKLLNVQLWNIANAAGVFKRNARELLSCSPNSLTRPYVDYIDYSAAVAKYSR